MKIRSCALVTGHENHKVSLCVSGDETCIIFVLEIFGARITLFCYKSREMDVVQDQREMS